MELIVEAGLWVSENLSAVVGWVWAELLVVVGWVLNSSDLDFESPSKNWVDSS